ncbi:hypothetical protein BCV72DRAFT_218304, partial [Rhizopus microsporus var. microsporus]
LFKGSTSDTVFVDISSVENKKLFVKELKEVYSDNSHLWGIEDCFRRSYSRLYAKITFSAEFTKKVYDEGSEFPSSPYRFVEHQSLSVNSEILTITAFLVNMAERLVA